MDKFNKELEKAKNPWIKRIGNYLLSREDLYENLKKEKKSLEECFQYILNELAKKAEKAKQNGVGFVSGDDQELYDLAVHYYDENNIKVTKENYRTNANGTANENQLLNKMQKQPLKAEKEKLKSDTEIEEKINSAVEKALDSYKKEQKELEKKRKEEIKAKKMQKAKAKQNLDQLDIFEILGDGDV